MGKKKSIITDKPEDYMDAVINLLRLIPTSILERTLKHRGYLQPTAWHTDDIKAHTLQMKVKLPASKLSDVINYLDAEFDASQGINWETIENAINECLNEEV